MRKGFTVAIEIDRPPAAVWAVMTDFARAPDWMPGIQHVSPLDEAPLSAGKRYKVTLAVRGRRGGPRTMNLAAWDPDNWAFALASAEGKVSALYRYQLEETPDGATRVRLEAGCEASGWRLSLLHPIIVRFMEKHDSRQLPRLKRLVEAGAPPGPDSAAVKPTS